MLLTMISAWTSELGFFMQNVSLTCNDFHSRLTICITTAAFLMIKTLADIFVNLNLKAPDPTSWSQEAFADHLWEKSVVKAFRDLLGHRLDNSDEGRLRMLTLAIRARFPQFRTYPIKALYFDQERQNLGLLTSLFVDGSSITWQTEDKLFNGSIIRDAPLTDCYFANGKTLRLSEDGVLTVFLVQDDTTFPLDRSVNVRIQLEMGAGVADIKKLLQTRGAKVNQNPPSKLSVSREHADMSVEQQDPAICIPDTATQRLVADRQTKSERQTLPRTDDSMERKTTGRESAHPRVNTVGGLPSSATKRLQSQITQLGKISKPQSDLKSSTVESPPKQEASVQRGIQGTPSLQSRQESINSQGLRVIQVHETGREISESLTPLTSEAEHSKVSRGHIPESNDRQADRQK